MSFWPTTRGGVIWRALLASILVIGLAAAATATTGLLQVNTLVGRFVNFTKVPVVIPKPGAPQTLLLIGSDWRKGEPNTAINTDTMMLVHIDDRSSTVNVISIPRDLEVQGPGGGPVKLNAIYSSDRGGGAAGLLKAIQTQIFPDIDINHVIDVNFSGFSDLIDAIGCVYTQVDHRYYNISQNNGVNDYSSINIEPGYQRLCGGVHSPTGLNSALAFVRFRHTDSDKVRNARQQDFIRWARDGYGTGDLVSNQKKLTTIFGQHARVDRSLASTKGLLDLFTLILGAQNSNLSLRTVPFPENFGPCGGATGGGADPCYVFACQTTATCTGQADHGPPLGQPTEAERATEHTFTTPTHTRIAKKTAHAPSAVKPPAGHHGHRPRRSRSSVPPGISLAGLGADPGDGMSQAGLVKGVGFPVYYPKYIPAAAHYCFSLTDACVPTGSEPASAYTHSYPRAYLVDGPGGHRYQSYVMTLAINQALGQYFTIQGTTWRDPPILRSPNASTTVGGRKLYEYLDGSKLALVSFNTSRGVYWVSNSLDNAIPNREMVAIAAEMTAAKG